MTPFVILLVLASTFMHAGWNLLSTYERSERTFYKRMLIAVIGIGLVPAVISEFLTRSITPLAWLCLVGSGFCAAVYLFGLARGYELTDFTVVYPLARALPVIFVAFADVLRGRYLTQWGWVGILFVSFGCLLVPLKSFTDIHLKNYFNRASIWVLLAAMGSVGYTLLDKYAAELVQPGAGTAARYGYFYYLLTYMPYIFFLRAFRKSNAEKPVAGWKLAIIAGILGFGAYWLILWAYQLVPNASYIVAFRQFSIVIGAIIAFKIYGDEGVAVRMTGAMLITFGLILIAVWGR
jgi:drug/metabolite transporter (DMT)-like permease